MRQSGTTSEASESSLDSSWLSMSAAYSMAHAHVSSGDSEVDEDVEDNLDDFEGDSDGWRPPHANLTSSLGQDFLDLFAIGSRVKGAEPDPADQS